MPPSWLLDVVDTESQETSSNATNSGDSANTTTSPIGTSSTSQSSQSQVRSPTNRFPEVRDAFSNPPSNRPERRAESLPTNPAATTSLDANPSSRAPPQSDTYGVSSEVGLTDVYPGISGLDRVFVGEGNKVGNTGASSSSASSSQTRVAEGQSGASTSIGANPYAAYAQGISDGKDSLSPSLAQENQNLLRALLQRQNDRRNQQEMENRLGLLEQLASLTLLGMESNPMASDRYQNPFSLANDNQLNNSFSTYPSMGGPSKPPPPLTVLSCEVCGTPTFQLCSGCQIIGYCNSEHQEKDWSRHAEECDAWATYYAGLGAEPEDEQDSPRLFDSPTYDDVPSSLSSALTPWEARQTPGSIFEVDAILLPANKERPELVKAIFQVVLVPPDSTGSTIAHGELCFDELLGKCEPWVTDAQWDEDMDQLPSLNRSASLQMPLYGQTMSRYSLHCRPNGRRNQAYIAVAGSDVTRQSAVAKVNVPVWGNIHPSTLDQHGNGNFLILRHPPKTCCPEVPGMLVEDATLDDLDQLVPYLQQRRHFMGLTGGVSSKLKVCPPRLMT